MACQTTIEIAEPAFDPEARLSTFRKSLGNAGALVSFTGLVRQFTKSDGEKPQTVTSLTIEHYPAMTARDIQAFVDREVTAKWPLDALLIIHRVGMMEPKDPIVMVAAASAHRRAAFESADCVMDYLKSRALFWKSETRPEGTQWIVPTSRDYQDASRWDENRES